MSLAASGVTPSVRHNDATGSSASSAALIFRLSDPTSGVVFSVILKGYHI